MHAVVVGRPGARCRRGSSAKYSASSVDAAIASAYLPAVTTDLTRPLVTSLPRRRDRAFRRRGLRATALYG